MSQINLLLSSCLNVGPDPDCREFGQNLAMKQQYGYLAVLNGRDFMNKWLLWFALVALVVGLVLSAIVNISVCMWGCPQTIEVYSIQASFFVLAGLIVWVGHQLFSKYP